MNSKTTKNDSRINPSIADLIHSSLKSTGKTGFEGLVATLLSELTGREFLLAKSGSQMGRDLSSRDGQVNVVAVECKKYKKTTEFDKRSLLGEIAEVTRSISELDLWVFVSSKEVDSVLFESLFEETKIKGIGFICISSGVKGKGKLEALLAYSVDTTIRFLVKNNVPSDNIRKIEEALHQIAEDNQIVKACEDLKSELLAPYIGFENWRQSSHEEFLKLLTSESESRAVFGQSLNTDDQQVKFIDRKNAWDNLDTWYQDWLEKKDQLLLHGEEGDGKTWIIASWLKRKILNDPNFPPIVFISPNMATDQDPLELISAQLTRVLNRNIDWRLRLEKWIGFRTQVFEIPAAILILDGINETNSPKWWRTIFDTLQPDLFSNAIATIISTRTQYWEEYFDELNSLNYQKNLVLPYNDTEYKWALKLNNLAPTNIKPELESLIRKPRYFDLMLRHREKISKSGDVTKARLIYEDWKDRVNRKRNLGDLSDMDFQEILKNLVSRSINDFKKKDIEAEIPDIDDRQNIMHELLTGGVFRKEGPRFIVEEKRLAYGLGLLLFDEVKKARDSDFNQMYDIILRRLEPQPRMELKESICEIATLHALSCKNTNSEIVIALLRAWIYTHNSEMHLNSDFGAYFPLNPPIYFDFAENIWAEKWDNPWAQEIFMRALHRWKNESSVSKYLPSVFEHWLSFVLIEGHNIYRRNHKEYLENYKTKLKRNIGFSPEPGKFSFNERVFTATKEEGLLRLGRVTLNVISTLDRKIYIKAVSTGCLAEAIMDDPDKNHLFRWLFISSKESIWASLKDEVDDILTHDNLPSKQAVYRLLNFEGSQEALKLLKTIPEDIFTPNQLQQDLKNNPCHTIFSWDEKRFTECIQKNNYKIEEILRKLKPLACNPEFQIPEKIAKVFGVFLQSLSIGELYTSFGKSTQEYIFEESLPALHAYAPHKLAEFISELIEDLPKRTEAKFSALTTVITSTYLVYNKLDQLSVQKAWEKIISKGEDISDDEKFREIVLCETFFTFLKSSDQIKKLLNRPQNTYDTISIAQSFKRPTNWEEIEELLSIETEDYKLERILWYLSYAADSIPHVILEDLILPFTVNPNATIKGYALKIICLCNDKNLQKQFINSNWIWNPSMSIIEEHWGSLIIAKYAFNDSLGKVVARVHPSYISHAIEYRGNQKAEIKSLKNNINALLELTFNPPQEIPEDLPNIAVSTYWDNLEDFDTWRLEENLFSKTIRFVSSSKVWGGKTEVASLRDVFLQDKDDYSSTYKKTVSIIKKTIQEYRAQGNYWLASTFPVNGLSEIIKNFPSDVSNWATVFINKYENNREGHIEFHAFWVTLFTVLIEFDLETSIKIYSILKSHPSRVRYLDSKTQYEIIDIALFGINPSDIVTNTWKRLFDNSTSDKELLDYAVIAQRGSGKEWLIQYAFKKIGSSKPLEKSRSARLLGFIDNTSISSQLEKMIQTSEDGWYKDILTKSLIDQKKQKWAKYWLEKFFGENDKILAWRSFNLFLECVQSSFLIWEKEIINKYSENEWYEQRILFYRINKSEIERKIKDNEKSIHEQLYGIKIIDDQVWPWIEYN